jgi:hypothetical protein
MASGGTLSNKEDIESFRARMKDCEEVRSDIKGLCRVGKNGQIWEYGDINWLVDGSAEISLQAIKCILDKGFSNMEILYNWGKLLTNT